MTLEAERAEAIKELAMSVLSKPYFHDEAMTFAHLEGVLWPNRSCLPALRFDQRQAL